MMSNFFTYFLFSFFLFPRFGETTEVEEFGSVSIDSVLIKLEEFHNELNGESLYDRYVDSVVFYEKKLENSKHYFFDFDVNCHCDFMKSDTCIESDSNVLFIETAHTIILLQAKLNKCRSIVEAIGKDSGNIVVKINTLRGYNRSIWKQMDGFVEFEYRSCHYKAFIYNSDSMEMQMHLLSNVKPHPRSNTIANLYDTLKSCGNEILMMTNAGMYTSDHRPQGLFINDCIECKRIDLGGPKPVNFYMLPNGVFFQRNDSLFVDESNSFKSYYSRKRIDINYATQSGPLLVHDGEIHHRFLHGSKNFHLRSGVGILSPKKAVFVISQEPKTRFYDFAVIFRDFFGCEDALYLDGAISEMYFCGDSLQDFNQRFGPMISIIKREDEQK